MKTKYRIKNQIRFTLFLSTLFIFTIIISNFLIGYNRADSMTKPVYAEIQVEYGDTLWELAREFGPCDSDTRKIVYDICRINDINADSLRPGQVILIPQS